MALSHMLPGPDSALFPPAKLVPKPRLGVPEPRLGNQKGEFGRGGQGWDLDKVTNEKVPYIYLHVCMPVHTPMHIFRYMAVSRLLTN